MKCLYKSLVKTVRERVRASDADAKDVYSALCNILWKHPENPGPTAVSLRKAGGYVADLRWPIFEEDYLDWYCSAPFEVVAPWVEKALATDGWSWSYWPDEEEGAPGHDPEAPRA